MSGSSSYSKRSSGISTSLSRWREVFLKRSDAVAALGLDERFRAMWEYYLAYCEGGFRERVIGTAQLVFEKPRSRCGRALGSLTPLVEPSC